MPRPLSPLERWYWIADQISPLNVLGRMTVEGRFDRRTARAGLDLLQRRHPALRTAIAETPAGGPVFVDTAGPIPLVWRWEPGARLESSARWAEDADRRHLAKSVDRRTGPLVRAEVVSASEGRGRGVHELVLVLHHAIADGTTAVSLVRQWAEHVAEVSGASDSARGRGPGGAPRLPAT
ncbi:condensation domain-containing protein, partial [Nocardiopsis lucentensis]|uniref:condensation domain-containing protein n=1 Tax=Nocardiopsis lucentensis TaxID=53441 RepID=UPI0004755766